MSTASSEGKKLELELPSLAYNLRDRKLAISICWGMIIFDSCILAVVLFYPLWYASGLSPTNVMAIVSSLVGVVSLLHYIWRFWVLCRKQDRRPLGGSRWQFDMFQWLFGLCVVGVALELIFGTIPNFPIIRLCSMPTATVMFIAAGTDLMMTMGYFLNIRLPCRISSLPKGEVCRPGIYTIMEDVVAVDGNGGRAFRETLDQRYKASPQFRSMLAKLSLFWSIPGLGVATAVTVIVWTTSIPVAFGIGWVLPFVWAAPWAVISCVWTNKMLDTERRTWKQSLTEA